MFSAYADSSALECVAMKAAITMPALLLQKPSPKSKAKENAAHLEHCMKLWLEGKLVDLLHEGQTIQRQLPRVISHIKKDKDQTPRLFAKLMIEGKVRPALRLITNSICSGSLS